MKTIEYQTGQKEDREEDEVIVEDYRDCKTCEISARMREEHCGLGRCVLEELAEDSQNK